MAEFEPNKLHQVLGTVTFVVLITIPILDGFEWFDASHRMMAILAIVFLILIGFGALIETWLTNR